MTERIEDPLADRQWWEPGPASIRFDFETGRLMQLAGIPPDMSPEADARYFALVEALAEDVGDAATLRATGYRYGPAADGDFAFIDLALRGIQLATSAATILKIANWLRNNGALETRISRRGVEMLGRWELDRRGLDGDSDLLSVTLTPGTGETPWGTPRTYSGYVLLFRLGDGRLATLQFALDGIFEELIIPPDRQSDVT